MILEVEQDIRTEVSKYDQMMCMPLNLLRIVALRMERDFRPKEIYSYDEPESLHTIIGIKRTCLEKWE